MMTHAIKSAFFVAPPPPQSAPCSLRSISLFHSTPVLERKRITHCNYYGRSSHKSKSWRDEDDLNSFPPNDDTAWFRRQYWSKGAKVNGFGSNESRWGRYKDKRKGGFDFCASSDDDNVETIFRSAFGGEGFYYWSFDSSDNFHWRNYSGQANRRSSWDWRYETDNEVDSPPQTDLASERLALGLKSSGPLKLDEVKEAYRACALRWHPDRHQGSSKAVAEEKFKHCSAAYKSLCEKLAVQ